MRGKNARRAALRTFFNIAKAWDLGEAAQMKLLGLSARSAYDKCKKDRGARLSMDALERISCVLGIFKALNVLLPDKVAADKWIKKPNDAPLFGGKSALDRMLSGRVSDLFLVRRYLDAQCGAVRGRRYHARAPDAKSGCFLSKEELAEVLAAENAADLVIGGIVDPKAKVLTLVRGDLSLPLLVIPFTSFKPAAGLRPNFKDFEIIDYGQAVRFGKYEATVASLRGSRLLQCGEEAEVISRERPFTRRAFRASSAGRRAA